MSYLTKTAFFRSGDIMIGMDAGYLSEAPRPQGGASRKGSFIYIVPLLPAGRQGPRLQGGACGARSGQFKSKSSKIKPLLEI